MARTVRRVTLNSTGHRLTVFRATSAIFSRFKKLPRGPSFCSRRRTAFPSRAVFSSSRNLSPPSLKLAGTLRFSPISAPTGSIANRRPICSRRIPSAWRMAFRSSGQYSSLGSTTRRLSWFSGDRLFRRSRPAGKTIRQDREIPEESLVAEHAAVENNRLPVRKRLTREAGQGLGHVSRLVVAHDDACGRRSEGRVPRDVQGTL